MSSFSRITITGKGLLVFIRFSMFQICYDYLLCINFFIYFITIYYGHKTGHKQVRGTKITWHNDRVIFKGDTA